MESFNDFSLSTELIALIVIIALWDAIWRLIALWKSARNNHLVWFICISIFSTAGILPIIYIYMNKNKQTKNVSDIVNNLEK